MLERAWASAGAHFAVGSALVVAACAAPSGKLEPSAVQISEPPAAAAGPATAPAAKPTIAGLLMWDPFADIVLHPPTDESPESWLAAYHRGERRRRTAHPDVVLYVDNPRACVELPQRPPEVFEITLAHRDREEGGPVTHYGVTHRAPCVLTGTPLHFDPPSALCSVVSEPRLERLWAALRSAELSRMKFTPPELPNPGFAITVTWPDARCFVDAQGHLDPRFVENFAAAKRAIAEAFDAGARR